MNVMASALEGSSSLSVHNPSSNALTASPEAAVCDLPCNNPEVMEDRFFLKAVQSFSILDETLYLQSPWNVKPLPALGIDQLKTTLGILTAPRKFKGREKAFEIDFTLAELFNCILGHNPQLSALIENIEIIGSAVPWILQDYIYAMLKEFGVEFPKEWVPAQLLEQFAKPPRDFDLRIHAKKASPPDILCLMDSIINFFVEKAASKNPLLDKSAFRKLLIDTGFINFSKPKDLAESVMSTIGFQDESSGCGIDIVIYEKLERHSLFSLDALFLNVFPLVKALQQQLDPEQLITMLEAGFFCPEIVPSSNLGNGSLALFDRLSGIVRADKPATINCAGWPCLLISYLKGRRCLSPDLERILLNKLRSTLQGNPKAADMPYALVQQLIALPPEANPSKKLAVVMAFWLKKAMGAHLGNSPSAALMLTIQACQSLKQNGCSDSIDDLWFLMKKLAEEAKSDPLLGLIYEMMDAGSGSFDSVISLLEVRAFLLLCAREQKYGFSARWIPHAKNPAIQIQIGSHFLLLPYQPSQALLNLTTAWNGKGAAEQLDKLLQPYGSYVKGQDLPPWIPIINSMELDFSKSRDRLQAEWHLACEALQPSLNGSRMILGFLPDLTAHYSNKNYCKRFLRSAEQAGGPPMLVKLYRHVLELMDKPDYAAVSIQLIWAMAMAEAGDPDLSLKAYKLWRLHLSELDITLKIPFCKLLIKKMSVGRPDLAAEILEVMALAGFTSPEAWVCLSQIAEKLTKVPNYKSFKSCQSMALTVQTLLEQYQPKSNLSSDQMEMLQSLFADLANYQPLSYNDLTGMYAGLLNAIEDYCPQEFMGKLLSFRKTLGKHAKFKQVDLRLAKILSRSYSASLKAAALQIYSELGDIKAALVVMESLIYQTINHEEAADLAGVVLAFLAHLPKDQHPIVYKVLQAKNGALFFKSAPQEAIKVIRMWWESLDFKNGCDPKVSHIFLKHVLALSQHLQPKDIAPWEDALSLFLESPEAMSIKPELKPLIIQSLDKLISGIDRGCMTKILSRIASLTYKYSQHNQKQLLEIWTGAEKRFKEAYPDYPFDEELELFKIEIFLVAGKPDQYAWAISHMTSVLNDLSADLSLLCAASKWVVMIMQKLGPFKKLEDICAKHLSIISNKIVEASPKDGKYHGQLQSFYKFGFEQCSRVEDMLRLLDDMLKLPLDFMGGPGFLMALQYLQESNLPIKSPGSEELTGRLIKFMNLMTEQKYHCTARFYQAIFKVFTVKGSLSTENPNDIVTELLIPLTTMISESLPKWTKDYANDFIGDRIAYLRYIRYLTPLFSIYPEHFPKMVQISMKCLGEILEHDQKLFQSEFDLLKEAHSNAQKGLKIKTKSVFQPLYIDNLCKYHHLNAETFLYTCYLIAKEFITLLDSNNLNSEGITTLLKQYLVFPENQKRTEQSALAKYLPMFRQNIRDVTSICYAKGVFENNIDNYFGFLFLLDTKDIPSCQDKMESAFSAFLSGLCESKPPAYKDGHQDIMDVVNIMERNINKLGFSPEIVAISWVRVIQAASKLIPRSTHSSWDHIMGRILQSRELVQPKTIPWRHAASTICKSAIVGFCLRQDLQNPLENYHKGCQFLLMAFKNGCFEENHQVYLELIKKLFGFYPTCILDVRRDKKVVAREIINLIAPSCQLLEDPFLIAGIVSTQLWNFASLNEFLLATILFEAANTLNLFEIFAQSSEDKAKMETLKALIKKR